MSAVMADKRIARADRRVMVRWPQVDERRVADRRDADREAVLPNPVASILGSIAADKNIAQAFRATLPSADPAWLQYRREEERAFPERDGPDGEA